MVLNADVLIHFSEAIDNDAQPSFVKRLLGLYVPDGAV